MLVWWARKADDKETNQESFKESNENQERKRIKTEGSLAERYVS